jgi:hypothetical protein
LTKAFDSEGICRIIEVCSKAGVKSFSGFGIKVSFVDVAQVSNLEPVFIPAAVQRAADFQTKESNEKDEQDIRLSQLEQMVIEDPARFEELLRSGDLEDEKT